MKNLLNNYEIKLIRDLRVLADNFRSFEATVYVDDGRPCLTSVDFKGSNLEDDEGGGSGELPEKSGLLTPEIDKGRGFKERPSYMG